MSEVKAECGSCSGTGLYRGFCEAPGTAVICLTCAGTGCQIIKYTPFTKRKRKNGIHTIQFSRGSFIGTGVGGTGAPMTYYEFEKRIPG